MVFQEKNKYIKSQAVFAFDPVILLINCYMKIFCSNMYVYIYICAILKGMKENKL